MKESSFTKHAILEPSNPRPFMYVSDEDTKPIRFFQSSRPLTIVGAFESLNDSILNEHAAVRASWLGTDNTQTSQVVKGFYDVKLTVQACYIIVNFSHEIFPLSPFSFLLRVKMNVQSTSLNMSFNYFVSLT